MKTADIVCGEQYGISDSQSSYRGEGSIKRCVVLDRRRLYANLGRQGLYKLDTNVVRPFRPEYLANHPAMGRILVAVEFVFYQEIDTNPETGQPWTDEELHIVPGEGYRHWNPKRTKRVPCRTEWFPYAARPQDLKYVWSEVEAWRANEKAMLEESYRAQIVQQAAAEVRRAEEAERNRKEAKQANKDRAALAEFYETRLEPALIEAGVEHSRLEWANGRGERNSRITLTYEAMYELLKKGGLVP